MRRFLLALGAVALGVVLGVLLAPHVLPSGLGGSDTTAGDERSEDSVGRGSERDAAGTQETAGAATPARTEEPTDEPADEPTRSPAQRADARAGVRDRDVPEAGEGTLRIVPGAQDAPDAEEVLEVRVEVEDGLPVDARAFATFVMDTLNDPRGWGHDGSVAFARTDGDADLRVVLASPDQVDQMCAPLQTAGLYSCGRYGHAALNAVRYAQGTEDFLADGSITAYRQYVITHEVGHLLGHQHRPCPGEGELAPVMQQQTISLDGCRPNPWPAP